MTIARLWIAAAMMYLALGYGSLEAQGNVPAIDRLTPASRAAGTGSFILVVTGTNFRDGAKVHWKGLPRDTEPSADGTRLNATILASDVIQSGTAEVTVVQQVGQQTRTSAPATFAITGSVESGGSTPPPATSNPAPAVTALTPVRARVGQNGFDLNVVGSNFVEGAVVRWGGAARRTRRVSATHLVAEIPASDVTVPGAVQITAFNPAPGGGTSTALPFDRIHYAPTIASLSTKTATRGGSGFTLTVGGANYLSGGSTVRWNGSSRETEFVSASQLKATIPASDLTTSGDVAITVATQAGRSVQTSAASTFTVLEATGGTLTLNVTRVARLGEERLTERGQFAPLDPGHFTELDCKNFGSSWVVVGVRGKHGDAVDDLSVGCQELQTDGTLRGDTRWASRIGPPYAGGTEFGERRCREGFAVSGMSVTVENRQLRGITFRCMQLGPSGLTTGLGAQILARVGGSGSSGQGPDSCSGSRPARAMRISVNIFDSALVIPLRELFEPWIVAGIQLICEQPVVK